MAFSVDVCWTVGFMLLGLLSLLAKPIDSVVTKLKGDVSSEFLCFSIETFRLYFLLALLSKSTKVTAVNSVDVENGKVVAIFCVVTSTVASCGLPEVSV